MESADNWNLDWLLLRLSIRTNCGCSDSLRISVSLTVSRLRSPIFGEHCRSPYYRPAVILRRNIIKGLHWGIVMGGSHTSN